MKESPPPSPYLISHYTLRRALGILGILLPFILVAGAAILKTEKPFQPSISHYYHTGMRDVFVAIVASYGLFLFTYKGHKPTSFWTNDRFFSNVAGGFAILVALFPTNETGECRAPGCYIHFISAALFFITLAYISLKLFTLSSEPPQRQTDRKKTRNKVYVVCGLVMLACILVLTLYFLLFKLTWPRITTFIFETIALIAFGVSWLTKGEGILPD